MQYLKKLALLEATERADRRIARLLRQSRLPRDKTLATLEWNRLPAAIRKQITRLANGEFLTGATNVCLFCHPGTGKSHVMAALGHELVRRRHSVLFMPVAALVERLLDAKRNLRLERTLQRWQDATGTVRDTPSADAHPRSRLR